MICKLKTDSDLLGRLKRMEARFSPCQLFHYLSMTAAIYLVVASPVDSWNSFLQEFLQAASDLEVEVAI